MATDKKTSVLVAEQLPAFVLEEGPKLQRFIEAYYEFMEQNGGAIDGTTIGASSAAAGSFTTINASGTITGNLTGTVTGNISGDAGGNAATATKLLATKTIGGTAFDGSANIDVKVKTVSDNSSLGSKFLTFVDSSTSTNVQDIKESSALTFTPSSGLLLAPKLKASTDITTDSIKNATTGGEIVEYVGGATHAQFKGNANTSTQWANSRQITLTGAISATITGLDGTGNVTGVTTFTGGGGSAIGQSDIASNAVSTNELQNDAVQTANILDDAVTDLKLNSSAGSEAVVENTIRNDAVSRAKLKDEVSLQILNSAGGVLKTIYGAGS